MVAWFAVGARETAPNSRVGTCRLAQEAGRDERDIDVLAWLAGGKTMTELPNSRTNGPPGHGDGLPLAAFKKDRSPAT